MKQIIKTTVVFVFFALLYSCESRPIDFDDFPDFPYTTTYFPHQNPLRTLVLDEDYKYDNDNDGSFVISVLHGGGYENKTDVTVGFVIDNSLIDNFYSSDTKLIPIPTDWYTLSNADQIVIPKGERSAGVTVTLKDAFFADPNSNSTYWVIPLRMTTTTADSILSGKPAVGRVNPDPRIANQWEITPKNYTIFGVTYVNEWHGRYLLQGESVIKGSDGAVLETIPYHARYIENSPVVSVTTSKRHEVRYRSNIRQSEALGNSPGSYEVLLDFSSGAETVTLSKSPNSQFDVTGTAKFVKDGGEWGEQKRNVITIDCKVEVPSVGRTYEINDTLTFRDKNVQFRDIPSLAVR